MNRTAINQQANKKLKQTYLDKGITRCEMCSGSWGLSFAHRKKRRHYKGLEDLSDFNETLLLCYTCHNRIEYNKELTEETFKRLRP